MRQIKNLEPFPDSVEAGNALERFQRKTGAYSFAPRSRQKVLDQGKFLITAFCEFAVKTTLKPFSRFKSNSIETGKGTTFLTWPLS